MVGYGIELCGYACIWEVGGEERLLLVAISELVLCITSAPTTLGRRGRLIRDEGHACKQVFVEPVL